MKRPHRFRKKPVVIEAMRWNPDRPSDVLDWTLKNGCLRVVQGSDLIIPTLEGDHRADPGDWIIRGVAGEFYPCKPDIFDATYEPA
jgi:hypothetical protein